MNSSGDIKIVDCQNQFGIIKDIDLEIPSKNTDLDIHEESEKFASIGSDSIYTMVWTLKNFTLVNKIKIKKVIEIDSNSASNLIEDYYTIIKTKIVNKDMISIMLENSSVYFYHLDCLEGIFINKLEFGSFFQLTTRNYKYFITEALNNYIYVWDFKMLFKRFKSYQVS